MTRPLSVALVWHMHQPYYREDGSGRILLPWVRRRASKDYVRMLETAMRFPGLRITMNFVPTLLEQLAMYEHDDFDDSHRELCLRDAAALNPAERAFLVRFTRSTDHPRRVGMFAPFYRLLQSLSPDGDISDADIRDLQVWTQLVWLDSADIERDAALSAIVRRGAGFDEEVKHIVDERQLARVREVLPALRAGIRSGCIEPMTSPYAHPILPLLIDLESARVARPGLELPAEELRLHRPEDAAAQIDRGLSTFAELCGVRPQGMWPSECAVSPAAASMMASAGMRWAISDEGVLAAGLGAPVRGDAGAMARLYRPYREASGLHMVFRDAVLSNRIGFDYAALPAAESVGDLLARLESIASAQPDGARWLVVIALDGENCWDYYEDNGAAFLDGLYSGLSAHPRLESVHVGDFIAEHSGEARDLERLWSGSWVDVDFSTWIGEPAHTRAWELLGAARSALDAAGGPSRQPDAFRQVMIAEGSDWFWWFSSQHESGVDSAWDELFRTHLRRVYELVGAAAPAALGQPILQGAAAVGDVPPLRSISPRDGDDPEWAAAGFTLVSGAFGAMQPAPSSIARILYGTSESHLHVRFGDVAPAYERLDLEIDGAASVRLSSSSWTASVPLPDADPAPFAVRLREPGRGEQRIPTRGSITVPRLRGNPVVLIAAECAPFAVAGELAETVRATAAQVVALQRACVVILPAHQSALEQVTLLRIDELPVRFGDAMREVRVLQGSLDGAAVLAIDSAEYFRRSAVYGDPDDGERYVFFGRAVVELLDATSLRPDVVHGFEWECAAALALIAQSTPRTAAMVLSISSAGISYTVPAEALQASGLHVKDAGEVDLLSVARSSADSVIQGDPPERHSLQTLYAEALARVRPAAPRSGIVTSGRI